MLKLALHHQLVWWRFEAVSSSAADWSAGGRSPGQARTPDQAQPCGREGLPGRASTGLGKTTRPFEPGLRWGDWVNGFNPRFLVLEAARLGGFALWIALYLRSRRCRMGRR